MRPLVGGLLVGLAVGAAVAWAVRVRSADDELARLRERVATETARADLAAIRESATRAVLDSLAGAIARAESEVQQEEANRRAAEAALGRARLRADSTRRALAAAATTSDSVDALVVALVAAEEENAAARTTIVALRSELQATGALVGPLRSKLLLVEGERDEARDARDRWRAIAEDAPGIAERQGARRKLLGFLPEPEVVFGGGVVLVDGKAEAGLAIAVGIPVF